MPAAILIPRNLRSSRSRMKKVRLDADDLRVLSFATAPMPGVRGTAKAAATGYPCYETVGYERTVCLAHP